MKLIYLPISFFILMFSCVEVFSQKLVKDGHQWNTSLYSFWSSSVYTSITKISGDTLVDGIVYSKLFIAGDTLSPNWVVSDRIIREDEEGKVFVKNGSSDESLIYDFNLEIGDSFMYQCYFTVASIDSVTLNNGERRKRLQLNAGSQNFGPVWIEGIGDAIGGLFGHINYCIADVSSGLRCFYDNDELLYPEAPTTCFEEFEVSVNNVLPSDIEIYPNPILETLFIRHGSTQIESFKLFDLAGKIVLETLYDGEEYNLQHVSAGAYIILLKDRYGHVYSNKLVKID